MLVALDGHRKAAHCPLTLEQLPKPHPDGLHSRHQAAGGQQPAEAPQLGGRIVAGSLGTGDAVAFPFSISRASVSVVAHPAEPAASQQRSRRREGATQQGFRGQLLLCSGADYAPLLHASTGSQRRPSMLCLLSLAVALLIIFTASLSLGHE